MSLHCQASKQASKQASNNEKRGYVLMNVSKLSFVAKVVATTLLSFQAQSLYAAPISVDEVCGDGCTRQVIKDEETKTVRVVTSSTNGNEYDADVYSYDNNNAFDHIEVNNSANFNKKTFMLFHDVNAKSLKVENTGKLSGRSNEFGPSPELGHISERFELKNSGVIELDGGAYGAISVNGSDTAEFYVENTGEMSFLGSSGLRFSNGKKVNIINKGTIRGTYAISLENIGDIFIENQGEMELHVSRVEQGNHSSLYLKSTNGKLAHSVELYGHNNTVELENTDVSNLGEINAYAATVDGNNSVIINQGIKIKTGQGRVDEDRVPYTSVEGMDKIVIGDKGNVVVVDKIGLSTSSNENGHSLTNNGILSLDPESRNVDVRYNLTENNGVIDLHTGSNEPAQTLTLHGNYVGSEGSVLRVDHRWNKDNEEENDLLIIKGTATGTTRVEVRDVSVGDAIRNDAISRGGWSKPLVIVEKGNGGKPVFTGMVDTRSAEQAHIAERVNETGDVVYAWVLTYAKTISGYTQAGLINQEMGLDQLGRLYERVGEQAKVDSVHNLNSWIRTRFTEGIMQGKNRFGVDSRRGLVQIGQDVSNREYESGYAHQGLMFSYSWANNKFFDRDPNLNPGYASGQLVGKGKSNLFSIGAYHTYYGKNNSYLDLVANLSWLENKYMSQQSANQKGYGAALGVEVGRSYQLNSQWKIEPQAQLKAQYIALGSIDDGVRKVERSNHFTVQGRLGVRLTDGTMYASANLVQDLTPAKAVSKIGQSTVEERYNATRFDISLGGNLALNKAKTLFLYGDLNYSRALSTSNKVFSHRNGRENYSAQVGIRFQW